MYLGNVMDLGNFKATTTPLATFQDQAKVPFSSTSEYHYDEVPRWKYSISYENILVILTLLEVSIPIEKSPR